MPLEETAWDILSIAAVAQRQGDDLTWLTPYWPVMETWYNFMKNLLPFPEKQVRRTLQDRSCYDASSSAEQTKSSCPRSPPSPPSLSLSPSLSFCLSAQLSTDDFDGPLFNATNLAVKGVAAIAAYRLRTIYMAQVHT